MNLLAFFVTALIRRMRKVMFSVCSHPRGVPHLHPIILPLVPCPFGGYPIDWSQFPYGGYPTPGQGVPGMWYPRPGMGHPPSSIRQHMEYLTCGGRCASCIQAGGLSCFILNLNFPLCKQNHIRSLDLNAL